MTNYTEHDVLANGINIHYYRSTPPGGAKPAKPTLVLIHGLTDNGMCWVRVADALRDSYDIVLPDTRGHGKSEKPQAGYDVEERAADVASLIDALGLDRPVLFGHSLGGQVATATAALYPEKVRALVLEDPAWLGGAAPENEVDGWANGLRQNQGLTREALIAQVRSENPGWHEAELAPWADSKIQMSEHALRQILRSLSIGWQEFARKIQCPTLLVTGEKDIIVNPAMVQEASALSPHIREANIPGAGHSIHRDRFEPYMEQVQAFLDTVA